MVYQKGHGERAIMRQGNWKSASVMREYCDEAALFDEKHNASVGLLG